MHRLCSYYLYLETSERRTEYFASQVSDWKRMNSGRADLVAKDCNRYKTATDQ